jgi:signal transduction histidine kinase/ActR/RegA family two-component response regulator
MSDAPRPVENDPSSLVRLVRVEQVRIIVAQVRRLPIPLFTMHACDAWIAWRAGVGKAAWYWLALITVAQITRWFATARMFRHQRLTPERMLQRLSLWLCTLACIESPIIVMVFMLPKSFAQYVLTMIAVGNSAGAVTMCAGHWANYASWALIYGGGFMVAWLTRSDFEGYAIALLLLFLYVILTLFVRDEGRTLRKLVELSESLRIERDRADSERRRAEAASEAKTRFFAAANHDLRQPLHALAINAATIHALAQRSGDELLGRVAEGVRRALAESRGLLDSLLEISRLDAGAIRVEWTNQDLAAMIAQARETFLALAQERNLDFCVEIGGNPPPARTDPELLRRILHNLIGNAIKFTPSGGRIVVRVARGDHDAQRLLIEVRDTGPGIAQEEQERIFEEFYQIGNPERDRSRGLGLGLAIVRRTAQLIGAQIALESRSGEGACFTVSLPTAENAVPAVTTAVARELLPRVSQGRARNVLLIDDEPEVRESLAILLRTLGWQVNTANGIAEAENTIVRGFEPDALLVDFRLRGGTSGLDAIQHLRERECRAPAILVTGDTEPARVAAAREAGLPVLYKPVDGIQLAEALDRLIGPQQQSSNISL